MFVAPLTRQEIPADEAGGHGRTLVRDAALVLTMDPALGQGPLGVIENGDVLFEGGRIVGVGEDLSERHAKIVDAAGKIVMPGFVDMHNHLWQSLIRGCGADETVVGWLDECIDPLFGDKISGSDAYAGARLSTLDLISTGVTTVVDFSHAFTPEFVRGNVRALDDSGLRFAFCYFGIDDERVIADMHRVKRELIDPNPRATFQVGSHPAPSLFQDLAAMSELATELDVPLNVHLLENIQQREENPFALLRKADALNPRLIADHAVHLTDEEIATLAANEVRVAHNPLSNMRLASGVIRLPELHNAGVQVGLGLDGGTNDTSDMFNNMRAAVGLQRATSLRADTFPSVTQVLRMATIGGAKALHMDDEIGSLTPGKKADLIVIDPSGVNFAPRFDWVNQLVFNGQPGNVDYVFVGGHVLKRDGRLVGPTKRVVQSAEDAARRVRDVLQLR